MNYWILFATVIGLTSKFANATEQYSLVYTCKTAKHTILVDGRSANTYRYRAWNLPKSTNVKPDLEVLNGVMEFQGTGVCATRYYKFKTGNVELSVDDSVACTESHPPKNAVGNLYVIVDGKETNHYYCVK